MQVRSAHHLLESAAEVTQQRDRDCLRESLLRTVRECLPARHVQALGLGDEFDDAQESPLLDELRARYQSVPRDVAPEPWTRSLGGGLALHVVPLGRSHPVREVLVVELGPHGSDDLRVLNAFARLYGNFLSLLRDAEQDRLTGLQNRRSFDARLSRLVDQVQTGRMPQVAAQGRSPPQQWWLALLDVDHFKKVNDTFGHLYGDEVLLLLSRILMKNFRGEDRCYRYGGEEFAVMLGASDQAGVHGALERLRGNVEAHQFPQVGRVTVSVGCALLEPGTAPSQVIDYADKALYHAKGHGRNRVACYNELRAVQAIVSPPRTGEIELF